jgi:hypothetical protein
MTNGSLFDKVLDDPFSSAPFDGPTFDQDRDGDRLQAQLDRVLEAMQDGRWHTLAAIAAQTRSPQASVSSRLRDLRKQKYGSRTIERRYVERGLWEYRLGGVE